MVVNKYIESKKDIRWFYSSSFNKFNLLILHGYNSSSNQNFFQNLKHKIEEKWIKTTILDLPNSSNPNIFQQTEYALNSYVFDHNTIILGHSLWSIIWLNLLQHLNIKINQYISVAGFLNNNLHTDRRYFNTFDFQFNQEKILENLKEPSIVIYDPKDKNIPIYQSDLLAKFLWVSKITLPTQKPHYLGEKEESLCCYIVGKIMANK